MEKLNGYLNTVTIDGKKYSKKFEIQENLENEAAIYRKMGIKFKQINKTICRNFFPGKTLKKFPEDKNFSCELKKKIEEFHLLSKEKLKEHDWFKYMDYFLYVPKPFRDIYVEEIKKIEGKNVVSHNDINRNNIIFKNGKVALIDFEWANINNELFDYVQIYIAENFIVDYEVFKTKNFQRLYMLALCFFVMWTYSISESKFILDLRKQYLLLLSKINIV